MNRREFIVRSGLLAASGLGWGGLKAMERAPAGAPATEAVPAKLAPLAVARGRDYACLLREAIEKLGGPRLLAAPGERVLIKAALTWNRGPRDGANVHPQVLRAVVELALEAGAGEVVVLDRTGPRAAFAYQASGAEAVFQKLGDPRARLVRLAAKDFVPLTAAGARGPMEEAALAGYRVARQLLEADRVVDLAAARHHPERRVSLALANLLGLIGGGPPNAGWLERQDLELAAIACAVKPEMTILDATRPVVRNGPMGRGPEDVERWDTILAGQDPLTVEAFGARLFGIDPRSLGPLVLAEGMGLGSSSLDPVRIIEIAK